VCWSRELTAKCFALTHLFWKIGQVLLRPMPGIVVQVCFPAPFKSLGEQLDLLAPLPGAGPIRCDGLVEPALRPDDVKGRIEHVLHEVAGWLETEPSLRIDDRQRTRDGVPERRDRHLGEFFDCQAACLFDRHRVLGCPYTHTDASCSRRG